MFNFGLYKEGLRKTRVLAILFLVAMILGSIVQPLAEISNYARALRHGWATRDIHVYGLHGSYMMMFALFAGAPILTLSIFSFLNKRSSSDFYHAIPHKRETLFGSFMAAVLTWVVGGMWLSTAIAVIIYTISPYAVVHLSSIMVVLIGMSVACLLVISAITLAMTVTGTRLSNIMTAGLIIFLPRLLTTLFIGMVVEATRIVDFGDFGLLENYNIVFGFLIGGSARSHNGESIHQMITRGNVYTFILAIIYLVVAGYLFKKRHSELAENPGSKLTQPIIRIAVTFVMTIPAMWMMLVVHSNDSWGILVFYLIALVGYFAYEFFTTKRIPQLIKMVPGLLIVVLLNFGFIVGVRAVSDMILQEINVKDISSVTVVSLGPNHWSMPSYGDLNARGLSITDEQVVAFLGETLNDRIRVSRARLRGESNQNWWHSREIRVTFNVNGGRNVTRRVGFDNDTQILNWLMAYEPYQALHLAIPENFDWASSWDDLTREEIYHVLDVLRDELQEVDFATWYTLIGGFGELTEYGHIDVEGMVNGHHYLSRFPMTELTPRTLALYRSYARHNIFRYHGVSVDNEPHTIGNILAVLGANYEGMLLSTEEEPYGLTLMNVDMTPEDILSTSAFIFTLFPDAGWIAYEVEDGDITVSREQIAEFLGQSEFENEAQLLDLLQERLKHEDLPEFLEVQ